MSTPSLQDLPAPPAGCDGWPWMEPVAQRAPTMPGGAPWPRVTVVTPSFNQAPYLEATIRSVLLQRYPALEYIVLDGGSTDGSASIIERYAPWLTRFRIGRDAGQAAAVVEGWSTGSGEVVAWLNSDDLYLPDAIATAAQHLAMRSRAPGVAGAAVQIDAQGRRVGRHAARSGTFDGLLSLEFLPQPAVFVRRSAVADAGGIDTDLRYAFDLDLWLRIAQRAPIDIAAESLAAIRLHADTITARHRPETGVELERIASRLAQRGVLTRRQYARLRGSVAFVRTSIHLDAFPRGWHRLLGEVLVGVLRYPPTAARVVAAALRRIPVTQARLTR